MLISNLTQFLAKRHGIIRAVELLIEAGFTGIDISMYDVSAFPYVDDYKEKCAEIKAMCDKAGVKLVQAHAPFNCKTQDLVDTYLERDFECCALLGIPNIVVHPLTVGPYNNFRESSYKANIEYYNTIKPMAKKYGVKIAVENMWTVHPKTKRIVDAALADPRELRSFVEDLNDPDVFTICLDLGHVALCAREPEDAIRIIGDKLECLHIHDVDYLADLHTLPGIGRINWDSVCKALADIDYKGVFNLEVENFLNGFLPEHEKLALKFMADSTRIFADKVEEYRNNK